jgi:diguanylate cyclase (GGDEF)-like protein/PAS domain S-box-containing protein
MAAVGGILLRISLKQESEAAMGVHLGAIFRTKGLTIFKDVYALESSRGAESRLRSRQLGVDRKQWESIHDELSRLKDPDAKFALAPNSRLNKCFNAVVGPIDDLLKIHNPTQDQKKTTAGLLEKQEEATSLSLDSLVSALAFKSEYRSGSVELLEFVVFILTVLLLAAEGRYLLIPGIRKLHTQFQNLETAGAAAEAQNKIFEAENDKLRADQELLQSFASNLEAANKRIEVAAKRFEELFQGLPIACFGYDESGTIIEWNRACEEMFGDATKIFGKNLHELLPSSAGEHTLSNIIAKVFEGQAFRSLTLQSMGEDDVRSLLCSTFPVYGPNDKVLGGIFSCVDLTSQKLYERQIEEQLIKINNYTCEIEQQKWELEEANARLESLARTDGLTGLLNHRSFHEALGRDFRRSERDLTPLSLILLDIDFFKKYNDTHGHPAGDALLKEFAQVLIRTCRESDVIARYGGEEFAIILPSTDAECALLAAERLRSAIDLEDWKAQPVTASIGVASLGDTIKNPTELVAASDKALYAAKAAGRNCVKFCASNRKQAAA